jgi:hypothetical protein
MKVMILGVCRVRLGSVRIDASCKPCTDRRPAFSGRSPPEPYVLYFTRSTSKTTRLGKDKFLAISLFLYLLINMTESEQSLSNINLANQACSQQAIYPYTKR